MTREYKTLHQATHLIKF